MFDFCLLCNSTPNASFAVLMLRIQINKGNVLSLASLYGALKWELWGKRAPCFWTEIVQLNFRNVLFLKATCLSLNPISVSPLATHLKLLVNWGKQPLKVK